MNLKKSSLQISIAIIFCLNFFSNANAQTTDDAIVPTKSLIRIMAPQIQHSIYIDSYYGYYTDSVGIGNFQKFPSVSPRSNSFGLNTAMLNLKYEGQKVRGEVTFHFGDIAKSAWAPTLNNIMEAHAGVKLCSKLWLDAGIFRTHFGTEGLLPKENFTSSVSVCTYYEPYYESGLRLKFTPNDKWVINLYALNGYNIIEDNNNKKSLGTLIIYTPNGAGNIGYSNYIGDDSPVGDSVSHLLIHQNLFWNSTCHKFSWQIGGDFSMKRNSDITIKNKTANMFAGVASLKFQCCTKDAVYARYEMFNDAQGIMSGIIIANNGLWTGYNLSGITAGLEYKPTDVSYFRLEARQLMMDKNQTIFEWKGATNKRLEVLLNFGITF